MWLYAVALAVFGIVLPWQKGIDMLDPLLILTYAALPMVLAGPLALKWSAGRAIAYSWAAGLLVLTLALATVNVTHRNSAYGGLLLPTPMLTVAAALLSLTGAAAIAGIAKVAERQSKNPRALLRGVLLLGLLGFVVCQRGFPDLLPGLLTNEGLQRLTLIGTPLLTAIAGLTLWWANRREPLVRPTSG